MTHGLDSSTRHFWRVVGRPVDIEDEHRWLDSPYTARGGSGDDWLREFERNGQVRRPDACDGLVESMTDLDGPEFTAGRLDPASGISTSTRPPGEWKCGRNGMRCSRPQAN